jgi:integrase
LALLGRALEVGSTRLGEVSGGAACTSADVYGATIHDARHTYAVHAVQSGIPEGRLQRLLGHSHPGTTRRYAMHAPEQFLDDDADRVARHMSVAEPPIRIERGA